MIGKVLYYLLVKSAQPDPPAVERVKKIASETVAAAELTNEVLPLILEKDPVPCSTT